MKSREDLETILPDILDELREAEQFFSVWRSFTDVENRKLFEPTIERYSQFFDSVVRAHFTAVIVTLYRIYEGGSKTNNLRRMYEVANSERIFNKKTEEKAAKLNQLIYATWKKVCVLRSNVFGHKSAKLMPEEAFRKANLSPNELRDMIHSSQELYNHISRSLIKSSHAFNINAVKDINNLMSRL